MLPIIHEGILADENRNRNLGLIRRRQELRASSDPFSLSENRFNELFRLNKRLTRRLIEDIRPYLIEPVNRKSITVENRVLCALRFFATGSYQRCIGEEYSCGLSQTVVHRSIHMVTEAILNIAEHHITLPGTLLERNSLKLEFMNKWEFPGVIGCVDGTHIAILKPRVEEHNYINRKGYHSINVQIICDDKLRIRSLFANFGGSTHDSFVWRLSQAQQFIRRLHAQNELVWFLGDSGYPLQPYLMTPFINPQDDAELRYNRVHTRARNCVERCFGLLKMRFRCLLKETSSRYQPAFMCNIIKVCAVLHNMCIEENIPFEEIIDEVDPPPNIPNNILDPNHQAALHVRNNLVNRYFR